MQIIFYLENDKVTETLHYLAYILTSNISLATFIHLIIAFPLFFFNTYCIYVFSITKEGSSVAGEKGQNKKGKIMKFLVFFGGGNDNKFE